MKLEIREGFTLIELLVVIGTMALLFGFGYANYRDFQRRQYLEGAARMVRGDLRLALEYALAGRKEPGCDVLEGYVFRRTSASGYRIEDSCNAGGGNDIKSVTLPADIKMDALPTANWFLFKVLGRGINRDSDVIITLKHQAAGNEQTITVTTGGQIK